MQLLDTRHINNYYYSTCMYVKLLYVVSHCDLPVQLTTDISTSCLLSAQRAL